MEEENKDSWEQLLQALKKQNHYISKILLNNGDIIELKPTSNIIVLDSLIVIPPMVVPKHSIFRAEYKEDTEKATTESIRTILNSEDYA